MRALFKLAPYAAIVPMISGKENECGEEFGEIGKILSLEEHTQLVYTLFATIKPALTVLGLKPTELCAPGFRESVYAAAMRASHEHEETA